MIRFVVHQFRYGCRSGFGRRKAIQRAVHIYVNGF